MFVREDPHPHGYETLCGKNFRNIGRQMRFSRNYLNRGEGIELLIMMAAEKREPVSSSLLFVTTHQKKGGISCVRKPRGFMIDLQSFGHLHQKRIRDLSPIILRRRSCGGR